MAHTQMDARPPLKAASAMGAYLPLTFLLGGSSLSETARLAASFNEYCIGLTLATVASAGDPVQWYVPGDVGKGIAGASMGAGAFVGAGSTNGVLGVVAQGGGAAGASRTAAVGICLKNAVAGDIVPILIAPQFVL